jgi:hypothetical protein
LLREIIKIKLTSILLARNTKLLVGGSITYRQPPDKLAVLACTPTTASSKPVWREVEGTMILPPTSKLVFPVSGVKYYRRTSLYSIENMPVIRS